MGLYFKSFLITVLILISGCIPVENVEEIWNQASSDQRLIGNWKSEDNILISGLFEIQTSGEYLSVRNFLLHALYEDPFEVTFQAKSIHLDGYSILIINIDNYIDYLVRQLGSFDANDISNAHYAFLIYSISNDEIVLYDIYDEDLLHALSLEVSTDFKMQAIEELNQSYIDIIRKFMSDKGDKLEKAKLIPVEDLEAELQKQKAEIKEFNSSVKKCNLTIQDNNQVGIADCNLYLYQKNPEQQTSSSIYNLSNTTLVNSFMTDDHGNLEFEIDKSKEYFSVIKKNGFGIKITELQPYTVDKETIIELERTKTLCGQILSKEGQEIPDANITVLISEEDLWNKYNISDLLPDIDLITDSNGIFMGKFVSKSQIINLIVEKDGYSKTFATNKPDYLMQKQFKIGDKYLSENKIYLDYSGNLIVQVIDELSKKPVPYAQVQVVEENQETEIHGKFVQTSDSNGFAIFRNLPPIYCKITLTEGYIRENGNIATRSCKLKIKENKESSCLLKTILTKNLDIYVVDNKNQPIKDVGIYIRLNVVHQGEDFTDFQYNGITNEEGLAEMQVPLNSQVKIVLSHYELGEKIFRLDTGISTKLDSTSLVFEKEEEVVEPVFSGRVMVPNGYSTDDIKVELLGTQTIVNADQNGNYEFELKTFDKIKNNKKIYIVAISSKENLIGITEVKSLDGYGDIFLKEGAYISGKVIDDYNEPISEASIGYTTFWQDENNNRYSCYLYEYGISDEDGNYIIDCLLPEHNVSIFPRKEGYSSENSISVEKPILGIENLAPLARLKRCDKTLRGKLVNQYGEPKQDWLIDTDYGHCIADHEGKFVIENVADEKLFIKYRSPDGDISANINREYTQEDIIIQIKDLDVQIPFIKENGKFKKIDYETSQFNEVRTLKTVMNSIPIPYAKVLLRSLDSKFYYIFETDIDGEAKLYIPMVSKKYTWDYLIEKVEKPGYVLKNTKDNINIRYNTSIQMKPVMQYINFSIINEEGEIIDKIRINYLIKTKNMKRGEALKQFRFDRTPEKLPIYPELDSEKPFHYEIQAINNDYYVFYKGFIRESELFTLNSKRCVKVKCMMPKFSKDVKYRVKLKNKELNYDQSFFREHQNDPNLPYFVGKNVPVGLEMKLIKSINHKDISTETLVIPEDFDGIYDLGHISFD